MIKDTVIKIRMNKDELRTITNFYSFIVDSDMAIGNDDIINVLDEMKLMRENNYFKSEIITALDDTIYLSVE